VEDDCQGQEAHAPETRHGRIEGGLVVCRRTTVEKLSSSWFLDFADDLRKPPYLRKLRTGSLPRTRG
jgi:hypothetical protein